MKKVLFDYGHGGSDSGALGYGIYEKNVVFELGRMTKEEIEKRYEVKVYESRSSDKTVSLKERTDIANRLDVDYLVSFHNNAFNKAAHGFESFVYIKLSDASETNKMRNIIHDEIMKVLKKYGILDRGKKKANFHMLRESNMPAILIEYLFIDNAKENALLKNKSFLHEVAVATAVGIAKAMNLKAKAQPKPAQPASSGTIYRVQVGAFKSKANAEALEKQVKAKGFDAFVKLVDGLYKVQVGAYSVKANAEAQEAKLKKAGFNAFITTK
ncbi:N-acetylmuramoyl-L-alanine amidase [Cytobacillus pseudoceanisediminis]|uniref:N-acetylmuramoyl-L-alanine amidase n=1 Tax=Cytobacillus pseudoceanisediminis TaxID=3051614 RepID=UPI003CFB5CA4